MKVEFDPAKREKTLRERGLDFRDAGQLFERRTITMQDDRFEYPEARLQTFGTIDGRLIVIVWTPADDGIRVISMRKCNERERRKFRSELG